MTVLLHVCVTCRAGEVLDDGQPCAGSRLHAALNNEPVPAGVTIVPVECLSACTRGATIALVSKGRWTYVYGPMRESDAQAILAGAAAYAETVDGIVPWRQRIDIFKKNAIARIPPIEDASQ